MFKYLFRSLLLLFLISNSTSTKFLPKTFPSVSFVSYTKIDENILKDLVNLKDFYIIDTRIVTTIALGYIANSLIIPNTIFKFVTWLVPKSGKIIIITDKEGYISTLNEYSSLKEYQIYGYCFYNEVIKYSYFNIEQINYDPNTYESINDII